MHRCAPLFLLIPLCLLCCSGCRNNDGHVFRLLPSSQTNIHFNNRIFESDTFNVLSFEYIYNGSGVGVGDVNNDGLTDIFFAGNMVPGALYLNRGGFSFEDITQQAGVTTTTWCTGVAMVDINQDGLLDIYVCTAQPVMGKPAVPNLLFINKGLNENNIPVFEEAAAAVGLADLSYATQAAFLDFDLDGDLDVYLLTNALEDFNRNTPVGQRHNGTGKSVDKLYRNEGTLSNGWPVFRDYSMKAGILSEGWGLGVVVNDINHDGYPDIYAANDFLSNDHLYINNRDGTFTNAIGAATKHQEHNGMGMDIADINNDGLNDIVVMDMMPEDNLRQKTMFSSTGYDRFHLNRRMNYQDQYTRNVLQLNNGNGTFSDIGYLAGMYATDWSWSSLLADLDNDGFRDLFVTNGYRKDITDLDFVSYRREAATFGSDKARLQKLLQEIERLEGVKKPNFLFRNNGDLTFADVSGAWGMTHPSYSNGAAYADFDNDGDLDMVINNINDEAFLYRNLTIEKSKGKETATSFLRLKLVGEHGNVQGLGARIRVYYNGDKVQYAEHQLQRGYKSSVEEYEHFGLGKVPSGKIDSLRIYWQRGRTQVLKNVKANQLLTLYETSAEKPARNVSDKHTVRLFDEVHSPYDLHYKHEDEDFVDFKYGQALLPQKHSQAGPGIAVGDIDGDGLEDFIIGGSAHKSRAVFMQRKSGGFNAHFSEKKTGEDLGMLLFDADADGDLDLYCVSGSSEFGKESRHYQDRFYRNDGHGIFAPDTTALPHIQSSGGCVTACDFDNDGDLDLFVAGRVAPQQYPLAPLSYLLRNDGTGKFEDITASVSPELPQAGMITAALWTDFNNDGWTDLALVGEWMPVTFFQNHGGRSFSRLELPHSHGWWNSLAGADFDRDGDIDYVAGNLGLNAIYRASPEEPVCLYAKDFDSNGSIDPVLCRYIDGKEYPVHPRETLIDQLVSMRRILTRYSIYGKLTFHEIFTKEQLKDAMILKSERFESSYIENLGDGNFRLKALPVQAQFSPLCGLAVYDVNHDENPDLLAIGNSYSSDPLTGFYDAGTGLYMQGDGNGNFKNVSLPQSGFCVDGDAKALARLHTTDNTPLFIATQNRDSLRVFRNNRHENRISIAVRPADRYAIIKYADGKTRREEFYFGSGYLSSSSRQLYVSEAVKSVIIFGKDGESREVR